MTDKQFDRICNILIDLGDHFYTEERFDTIQKSWNLNLTEVLIVLCNEVQKSREQSDQNSRRLIEKLQNLDHSLKYLRLSIDTAKQEEEPSPIQKHFNEHQVAEITGLSVKTLQHYRRQKRGPTYLKMDRRVLYPESDLAAWLESKRTSCLGESG
tara:strand:+ start:1606 stop:2070 length:465 start_codon:yes stop_codon:yes gene_type:complete